MFIEKITFDDIVEFISTTYYSCAVNILNKYKNMSKEEYEKVPERVRQFQIGSMKSAVLEWDVRSIKDFKKETDCITFKIGTRYVKVTDFDFEREGIKKSGRNSHNLIWIDFMRKKFGKSYADAYCKKFNRPNADTPFNA